ncbi:hypothetical protein A3F07_02265 [candidate division WWE3 bacterium RIFCSPHIGHO2_12_FULL_38_15]|uniref:Uncharacterized protein n=1 Tax=candidate division WWE3 bacterium RIFCSPHIGHO2_02_FULL_38_14 TaxID=1802620 RepID=A0A1F4V8B3_UNCKA|nr:MAG: hypothetical protein A2793_03500 [candidate division WWE3 bacterium RIFCSPHIGHO2_01_FULL_38_45]OGC48702.1 MAG: hypothetical protein A3F07_02265 [candidate division WWE3 bacterium RIFCSPHIGHO2_12_FULL_38_15]OGC53108.1 MAG: hypothetical protein A3B64_01525 [candidate division WWE3 bacterium RIFCSPLOWO2_01_FULL_37_24]OGC53471.1 MAG: hypothetical protein A3D91_00380 [candidate division WWE3 bacterium RIFCSPHIGHO2_02_FULL_38_14]HLB51947.1 hypothetical protein [Patescibacteria group bacterium
MSEKRFLSTGHVIVGCLLATVCFVLRFEGLFPEIRMVLNVGFGLGLMIIALSPRKQTFRFSEVEGSTTMTDDDSMTPDLLALAIFVVSTLWMMT